MPLQTILDMLGVRHVNFAASWRRASTRRRPRAADEAEPPTPTPFSSLKVLDVEGAEVSVRSYYSS